MLILLTSLIDIYDDVYGTKWWHTQHVRGIMDHLFELYSFSAINSDRTFSGSLAFLVDRKLYYMLSTAYLYNPSSKGEGFFLIFENAYFTKCQNPCSFSFTLNGMSVLLYKWNSIRH